MISYILSQIFDKVTKSEQWPKCHKFWSKVKKLQILNNDCNVTNSYHRSKSYKFWTMTELSQILIKGQKVTNSEQWPKCRKFRSEIQKLQIKSENLNNAQNVTNSDQQCPPEFMTFWTLFRICNFLTYDQNLWHFGHCSDFVTFWPLFRICDIAVNIQIL